MAKNKIGRNDPCPCGSGKKYKKCCLKPVTVRPGVSISAAKAYENEWEKREVLRWIEHAKTHPEDKPSEILKKYARKHGMYLSDEHLQECRAASREAARTLAMFGAMFGSYASRFG